MIIIKTTTDQIDILCMVSIVLKKAPFTYTEDTAEFCSTEGHLIIDWKLKEMQFLEWNYTDDVIYLQLLGICNMFDLQSEDYKIK
jgi:hypothetical protein